MLRNGPQTCFVLALGQNEMDAERAVRESSRSDADPSGHRKPTAKARPAAHSSAPAARLKRAAPGAVFSRSTYTARMTIHGMFMTPVVNSIVINAQQQPRQWRPFRTPARTAPNRVDSTPRIDSEGRRQRRRHVCFNGLS